MFIITSNQENANQNSPKSKPTQNGKEMEQPSTNARGNVERRESLFALGGTANWFSHYGNQCEEFSRSQN